VFPLPVWHGRRRPAPGASGRRFGPFLCIFLTMSAHPAVVAGQFAVYPVVLTLETGSEPVFTSFTVENHAGSALELSIYASDYDRAGDESHAYIHFGEHEHSCAGRLEAVPAQIGVPAGERAEVRLRLDAGPETCWGMIFVEHRAPGALGVTVAQRIAVKVIGQPAGLARSGAVLGLAQDTTAEPAVRIAFENQGPGVLLPRGELEIHTLEGEVVGVVPVAPFKVLPQRRRILRVPLNGMELPPGRYVAVGIVDFHGDYLAGGQTLLELRP
jgi:hypothetical protein